MASLDRAVAAATREVADLLGMEHQRVALKVEKFGRHPDGYLHAQVSLNGEQVYVWRRWGSWEIPGTPNGFEGRKFVLHPFDYVLQEHAAPFDARDHKRREDERAAAKKAANPGGDDEATAAAGVPDD